MPSLSEGQLRPKDRLLDVVITNVRLCCAKR